MSPARRSVLLAAAVLLSEALSAPGQVLVATNSTWSYRKGTNEASSPREAWRMPEFDASGWAQGRAPFYYDSANAYTGATALPDMRNRYTSVYMRRAFVATDVDAIGTLGLRFLCDDGFALWINGRLAALHNKSEGSFAFNATAAGAAPEPLTWLGRSLTSPQDLLVEGTNTIAVQAFNASLSSSDFVIDLELTAHPRDTEPPGIASVSPAPGETDFFTAITVTFSEPVSGVGFSDLLLNGRPAVGVTGSGAEYTFLVEAPAMGEARVTWDEGAAIFDFADPPNRFDAQRPEAQWAYQIVDRSAPVLVSVSPAPGATVRELSQVEVRFSEAVSGVDASDLLVNGQAAAAVSGSGSGPYVFLLPANLTGSVEVAWASGHGIQDGASPANAFQGEAWSYQVDPAHTPPRVRITEFLAEAAGDEGFRDEDDSLEDWIELRNESDAPVNLRGWALTDDLDNPGKWVFPDLVLGAGEIIVVFASGKDRRTPGPGRPLHTNFKLSVEGEDLALFDNGSPRILVDAHAPFGEQRPNHSFGLDSQGRGRYFAQPTPGAVNGESDIVGVVPAVEFNVERGLFRHPFELHLTTPLDGVEIRYTLDGSEPTATSLLYSGPLAITRTTIIRASGHRPGYLPSVSVTHSYLFPETTLSQPGNPPGMPGVWIDTQGQSWTADYEMDPEIVNAPGNRDRVRAALEALPSISIVTRPGDMFDNATGIYPKSQARGPEWERPASVEFIYSDGDEESIQVNCGVQMQGNSVRDPVKTAKHAFRLVFKGDYGPGTLRHRVFPDSPMEEFNTLTLRADFNNSWMHWSGDQRPRGQRVRDAWMKDTQRAMGGMASHSRFYHLYVNGLYWGIYDPTERPDAAYAASYMGGEREDYDVVNEGQLVDGNMTAYNAMRAISVSSDADYERMKQYLDVPAYIDYVLLHFYTGHEDWFTDKNWYAIRKRRPGEGFRYFSWDGELMLNSLNQNIVNRDDQPSNLHPRLRANAQYRLDFADRAHKALFNGGALSPEAAAARYQKWVDQVAPAMIAESARWGDYRRDVHQYSSGPYQLHTVEGHFIPERNRLLQDYFPRRASIVLTQLRAAGLYPSRVNAPVFNQHGGLVEPGFAVEMSAAVGTIYYTTDETDPRVAYSGAVAPGAKVYEGPVALSSTTRIKARAFHEGEWSALTEAVFEMGRLGPDVEITEIHYHPDDGELYEFLELRNVGSVSVDLSGFSFEGINYVFPPGSVFAPGQIVTLASGASPEAFSAKHPGVMVFGYFSGNLSNSGERIALRDRSGATVVSVEYDDGSGWPVEADGDGPSVERIDLTGDPNSPASWRASAIRDGTPGRIPDPPAPSSARFHEVFANAGGGSAAGDADLAFVEVLNAGSEAADVSGWRIRDAESGLVFMFPLGSRIEAGSYAVVSGRSESASPGWMAPFELKRSGGTLFLEDAARRIVDAVAFGLQAPGCSVGRSEDGAWVLCVPTPGAANEFRDSGSPADLRINEWMANPRPGEDDWLELHNMDSERPVALYGIQISTATRRFQIRSLSYAPPGGYVVLKADEKPGPDHLNLRLPASGGLLRLHDAAGRVVDEVDYPAQAEGVSMGRWPDGNGEARVLAQGSTPGGPNVAAGGEGPILSELMVWESGDWNGTAPLVAGWVELFNAGTSNLDLTGVSLRGGRDAGRAWSFPAGQQLPPRGFIVVRLDPGAPASTNAQTGFNTGWGLDPRGDRLQARVGPGLVSDSVEFGFQAKGFSLGRQGQGWALLGSATPGAANGAAAQLGPATAARINEWFAFGVGAADWIELYNTDTRPIPLEGLYLSDTPALSGAGAWTFGPRSFMGPKSFLRIQADGSPELGGDHARFQLSSSGEAIVLATLSGTLVDAVYFGPQVAGVSQGRYPDGADGPYQNFVRPTPGSANGVEVNRPPVLAAYEDRVIAAGSWLEVASTASDPDEGQVLSYSLRTAPDGMTIDAASGWIRWRPSMEHAGGTHEVEVVVRDNGAPPLEAARRFHVTVAAPAAARLEIVGIAGGILELVVTGSAGVEHEAQASENLRDWQTLGVTNSASGVFRWLLPMDSEAGFRFVRVLSAP